MLLAPGDYPLTVSEPQGDGSNRIHADILAFTVGERGSPTARDNRTRRRRADPLLANTAARRYETNA